MDRYDIIRYNRVSQYFGDLEQNRFILNSQKYFCYIQQSMIYLTRKMSSIKEWFIWMSDSFNTNCLWFACVVHKPDNQ